MSSLRSILPSGRGPAAPSGAALVASCRGPAATQSGKRRRRVRRSPTRATPLHWRRRGPRAYNPEQRAAVARRTRVEEQLMSKPPFPPGGGGGGGSTPSSALDHLARGGGG